MIRFEVTRKKQSYNYKFNPQGESSFENNWLHNCIDIFRVYYKSVVVFSCNCQSVANYNWGDYKTNGKLEYGDTIDGKFQVELFVEPRNFHGEPHGIINAVDKDGQKIDKYSMQTVNGYQTGRWLIHDKYSFKIGKDTNSCWSAGCIIMASKDLEKLNETLRKYGAKKGDIIDGEIVEC